MSLIFLLTLFGLTLFSSEWIRLKVMEYFSINDNFFMATDMGIKILRKRTILRELNSKTETKFINRLDSSFASFLEENTDLLNKEWNASKVFVGFSRDNLNRINSLYDKMSYFRDPNILEEFISVKHYNLFVQSQKPYIAQTGYLENDLDPFIGRLSNFGYSGGFAIDYRLRSIGANLGSKKPVIAIRLRSGIEKTRVRPENLSLWTSNDNRLYLKHTGNILFFYDSQGITLNLLEITTQYLKIHCNWKDDKYTFANNLNSILSIYGPPYFQKGL